VVSADTIRGTVDRHIISGPLFFRGRDSFCISVPNTGRPTPGYIYAGTSRVPLVFVVGGAGQFLPCGPCGSNKNKRKNNKNPPRGVSAKVPP